MVTEGFQLREPHSGFGRRADNLLDHQRARDAAASRPARRAFHGDVVVDDDGFNVMGAG
ncbi:hypothetical protein D3C87_2164890 [compost metagenome]